MGELDFDKSTQAKYWMFDEESLRECREEASKSVGGDGSNTNKNGTPRVRKTASGYHHIRTTKGPQNGKGISVQTLPPPASPLTPEDQELLVHFHAHQIQRLIGPNAIFPALRRSSSVLSTAIMLFRRFYLSNSVIDFHPRDIAAASALLACKADCERRLPVSYYRDAALIAGFSLHKGRGYRFPCLLRIKNVTTTKDRMSFCSFGFSDICPIFNFARKSDEAAFDRVAFPSQSPTNRQRQLMAQRTLPPRLTAFENPNRE